MKKIFIFTMVCCMLLCLTGCGCSRREDKTSFFYNKELSFDYDSMGTMSVDIEQAIEKGLEDATPITMTNGHFHIERNNYSYTYEESGAKIKANFYEFSIDARADEKSSHIIFKGIITIDFENIVEGESYAISSKNHKVIEYEIDSIGNCIYDEKTGNFTIGVSELKEIGTITQIDQNTTTTDDGYVDEEDPVTNTWEINDTFNNFTMKFVPHAE